MNIRFNLNHYKNMSIHFPDTYKATSISPISSPAGYPAIFQPGHTFDVIKFGKDNEQKTWALARVADGFIVIDADLLK